MTSFIFFLGGSLLCVPCIVVLQQEVWKEDRVSDRLTGRKVHLARKPPLLSPLPPRIYLWEEIMVLFALSQTQIDIELEVVFSCYSYIFSCWLVPFSPP